MKVIENRKNINRKCPNNEGEGIPEKETLKKSWGKEISNKRKKWI